MSVVVHWLEASPYGPSLEFLCAVDDMGAARSLASAADAMDAPTKHDRLGRSHPLVAIAEEHFGELLWRVQREDGRLLPPDDDEHPWAVGVDGAQQVRLADADRFNSIYRAAQERRRERRRSGGR